MFLYLKENNCNIDYFKQFKKSLSLWNDMQNTDVCQSVLTAKSRFKQLKMQSVAFSERVQNENAFSVQVLRQFFLLLHKVCETIL